MSIRPTEPAPDDTGLGVFSMAETEAAIANRLSGMSVDTASMMAVSNIYRAANSVRNYLERKVLAQHGLSWTSWVVLWVIWIWGSIESRYVAAEAGISKGTLTGVVRTLTAKGLVVRTVHPDDARRVLLALTDEGAALMVRVFPEFNRCEAAVTGGLDDARRRELAELLRVVAHEAE